MLCLGQRNKKVVQGSSPKAELPSSMRRTLGDICTADVPRPSLTTGTGGFASRLMGNSFFQSTAKFPLIEANPVLEFMAADRHFGKILLIP